MVDIVAVLNIGAAEMLVIALIALIVVGPDQLPALIRRVGQAVAQVRSMTDGIKDEFMSTIDENEDLKNVMDPKSWTAGTGSKSDPVVPRGSSGTNKLSDSDSTPHTGSESDAAVES